MLPVIESAVWSASDTPTATTRWHTRARKLVMMIARCEEAGASVFFLGSQAAVIYALRNKVQSSFPALTIAGVCDTDFSGSMSREILKHIAQSRPDIIITDMSVRDHAEFARLRTVRFPQSRLANFPGAFRPFARPGRTLPWIERAPIGRRPKGFLDEAASALGFSAIILGQCLRGLLSARRVSRAVETPRRGR